jgi:TRAP-type C4-dicarboxylate transport system permease small subunit
MELWLNRLDRQMGRLTLALAILAGAVICMMAIVICVEITARYFGITVIQGSVEIVSSAVVAVSFLALPVATRQGAQIRSTVLRPFMSFKLAAAVDAVAFLLTALLFATIIWTSWDRMVEAWVIGEVSGSGSASVPAAPARTALIIGSVAMILECLLLVSTSLISIARGEEQ